MHVLGQIVEVFARDHPIYSHYRSIQIKEVQISESLSYNVDKKKSFKKIRGILEKSTGKVSI